MAKPKSEIEKIVVSIKIEAELKKDIQSLATVYEKPFTVYIEELLKKHVEERRTMINEQKEANRRIIERQEKREMQLFDNSNSEEKPNIEEIRIATENICDYVRQRLDMVINEGEEPTDQTIAFKLKRGIIAVLKDRISELQINSATLKILTENRKINGKNKNAIFLSESDSAKLIAEMHNKTSGDSDEFQLDWRNENE